MTQKSKLSQREVDEIVISQADDDDAWEEPIDVKVAGPSTMVLTPKLAVRAAFLPSFITWTQLKHGWNKSFKKGLPLKKRLLPE